MKTITNVASSVNKDSRQSHCAQDAGIVLQENPTLSCLQKEELSSTNEGYQRTMETSMRQSHYYYPNEVGSLLEGYPKIVEISNEEFERIKMGLVQKVI